MHSRREHNCGFHRGHGLNLDLQDIVDLRQSGGDGKAYEQIVGACIRWVSDWFPRTLSHADCEDIVNSALLAVIDELKSSAVPPAVFRQHLEERLEDECKKRKKYLALFARFIGKPGQPQCPEEQEDDELQLTFWRDVVDQIEMYMFPALVSLSEKDQILLIQEYGLKEMDVQARSARPYFFLTRGARKKALSRARARFNKHLEDMLLTALEVHTREQALLEAALRIVRGKAVVGVVAAVQELTRER